MAAFAHRVGYGPAVAELTGPVHVRAGEPFTLDLLVRSPYRRRGNHAIASRQSTVAEGKLAARRGRESQDHHGNRRTSRREPVFSRLRSPATAHTPPSEQVATAALPDLRRSAAAGAAGGKPAGASRASQEGPGQGERRARGPARNCPVRRSARPIRPCHPFQRAGRRHFQGTDGRAAKLRPRRAAG